jgi:hypothetical protein
LIDSSQIRFEPEAHKYFTKDGKELISASTLVGLYKPEFDPTGEILSRCSAKKGITPEELQKEWDFERDSASERGNTFHDEAEHWVKTKTIKEGKYKDVIEQLARLKFRGKLWAETKVFSKKLLVAGTIDLIDLYNKNQCSVIDYKTNKKLKTKSFFKKGVGFEKMLYPINHLMNCNFVHYSLQQEIYTLLLEEHGYWVNNKVLLYVNPETRLIEKHPIMPLRKEAQTIIEHHTCKGKDFNKIKYNTVIDNFDF